MSSDGAKATIVLSDNDFFVGITPSKHSITMDADRERNLAPSPMELLLLALGSCTGVDVVSILRKRREQVNGYRVEVRGERRGEHPRSYSKLEVHHIVTGRNISERSVEKAIKLSEEQYCSVAATLRPAAEIVSTFEIIEG